MEEQRLMMELLDVFTDVDTPSTSDDDDPAMALVHPPRTGQIGQLLQNMLATSYQLTSDTGYSALYKNSKYMKNVKKKLQKMKKNARRCDFEKIYRQRGFWDQLNRIRNTYADDGGRVFLNFLVALECHLTTEYSESESESDDDENSSPAKKRKSDDDDNGENDGNMGGQVVAV